MRHMSVVTDLVVPQLERRQLHQLQPRDLLLLPPRPPRLLLLPLLLVAQLQLQLRLLVGVRGVPQEHSHPLKVEAY